MQHGSIQLRDWQTRQGIDQVQAALKLGIHKTTYGRFLHGLRLPGRALAIHIQSMTGIPVNAWVPLPVAKRKKTASTSGRSNQCFQGGNANAR